MNVKFRSESRNRRSHAGSGLLGEFNLTATSTLMKYIQNILVYLTLRAHGWKRTTLNDGTSGWCKQVTAITTRKGGTRYALAHLVG